MNRRHAERELERRLGLLALAGDGPVDVLDLLSDVLLKYQQSVVPPLRHQTVWIEGPRSVWSLIDGYELAYGLLIQRLKDGEFSQYDAYSFAVSLLTRRNLGPHRLVRMIAIIERATREERE